MTRQQVTKDPPGARNLGNTFRDTGASCGSKEVIEQLGKMFIHICL